MSGDAYRDQFGNRLTPVQVTCRRSLPSRAIVKICSLPARLETNAMCRPFGANAGLSLLPIPSVTVRVERVRKSKILMLLPPPARDAYAISLYGAGDHVGRSHAVSRVICTSPVPSTFTT